MKIFVCVLNGEKIEVPATLNALKEGEKAAGCSLIDAIGDGINMSFVQGVIYGGLHSIGRSESFEDVGNLCSFSEVRVNYEAIMSAMSDEFETLQQEVDTKPTVAAGKRKASNK